MGVQWHPERDEGHLSGFEASGRRLFEALARVAGVRAAAPR
jgi:hypothetical protein